MLRTRIGRSLLVLTAALSALLAWGPPSWAATFVVNSTADEIDANPGDGVCETSPGSGTCTLRAAILEANALAGADHIALPAGTYGITRGRDDFLDTPEDLDLDITGDLDIAGAGASNTLIDGICSLFFTRVFDIGPGATVTIMRVTIRNGCPLDDGGGLRNAGVLTLTDTVVAGNTAFAFGVSPAQAGGGIRNDGTLTLRRCAVTGNTAFAGRNVGSTGGGIFNTGTLAIEDSTISDNDAGYGGGIANSGTLTIGNSTISGNVAGGFLLFLGPPGTPSSGSCGGVGGGILGVATLASTTVAYNVASPDTFPAPLPGCPAGSGAGLSGASTLHSTIVYDPGSLGDCDAPVVSSGHNLAGDGSCALAGPGDQNGTDPLLAPLASNGGPTRTHRLVAGSPAIDAGDAAGCLATDQRGVSRPQGAGCDIGAYEATGPCGNGVLDPGETCDDGNPFDGDCCSSSCQLEAAGSPCGDEGIGCTDDVCDGAGTCQHAPDDAACEPCTVCEATRGCVVPVASCQAASPGGARLFIRNGGDDTRDALTWKWKSGGTVAVSDFGDPTASTGFVLCVLDHGASRLKLGVAVPTDGTCGGGPCWQPTAMGFKLRNPSFPPAGSLAVDLKAGGPRKGAIVVRRRRGSVGDPGLPVATPVTVRLLRRDGPACWESVFGEASRNDAGQLKARSD